MAVLQHRHPCWVQTLVLAIFQRFLKKKYPLLLRRKNFFQMSQQAGQDERAFLKQLKSAAAKADIEGMYLEDALCLTLLSGLRDARLREKLSKLEQPTLPAFGVLIDAYLHSKATSGPSAAVNRTEGRDQQQKRKQGGQKISDAEKKCQNAMKSNCFRCGSGDHMANNCRVAKDVKCRSCGAQGHIQSACGTGKTRATEEAPGKDALAIQYQSQQYPQQGVPGQEYAQANVAMAQQGHNSWPRPPLLL